MAATDDRVARVARGHIGVKITRRTPPEQCEWTHSNDGKWSRGLTKETDDRVARNARAHVGMQYVRRVPLTIWRERHSCQRVTPLGWSRETAYALGLLATDGWLSSDGRHVGFVSAEEELVETFLRCVGHRPNARLVTRHGRANYEAQLGDVELYRWSTAAGLMPRKSLVLGGLKVPDGFLLDVVRGLLDGDGSVVGCSHRRKVGAHMHHHSLFHSASRPHLDWLRSELRRKLGVEGKLSSRTRAGRVYLWILRYNTEASRVLLGALYADASAPRLERKWRTWEDIRQLSTGDPRGPAGPR